MWPSLRYDDWKETLTTLHLWTQVPGKIRLALEPLVNHWWNVTLYVTPRGLTTASMPYGERAFRIDFDFVEPSLRVEESGGRVAAFPLEPMSVATFYRRTMETLRSLGIDVDIDTKPCEVADPIRFEHDETHRAFDAEYARRFWQVMLNCERVFVRFRARFLGKVSPVHFFWGAPDLAVTRFSGRIAPPHPGGIPNLADSVTREAYSHEVSSAGWWPGGFGLEAAFYSYAYPEPAGFAKARVEPGDAYYNEQLREFMLPYESVRTAKDPDAFLMTFLQSTYDAAATLGAWPAGLVRS